ncbi:PPC domain-containing DNA-binding protein [Prochlorothrix hollandica]|uniref:DNA-binding protein with PD1-like DNA-binding motif n=1 Tax=Prochlorothrix hollandica PCC 9006 = CALU 1027 TaxID=317619 RepID=A0A0M2Q1G0_PROHO|nr:PPC domain-containing DNA-binding protein [Prochlorothrix hollandica]KKJ01138.1 DNA-binding protein with PD1-like DNA-binding motif [Prochlorothrix hollandica PCC 9006 = CALU 1027]
MKVFALRLKPNDDLKQSLSRFAAEKNLLAGCIVTTVGSLHQAALRFANRPVAQVFSRKFEIISLSGTLSVHGIHVHISVADGTGQLWGGHLEKGCLIYTTAEIVVAELPHYVFDREIDRHTGYSELIVRATGSEVVRSGRKLNCQDFPERSD